MLIHNSALNKAKLYLSNGQYSLAKSYANKALTYKGANIYDAYLLMGDAIAYSSSSCSSLRGKSYGYCKYCYIYFISSWSRGMLFS